MREFSFRSELLLPRKREEVFRFFADAGNLETLTPPWLNFHVLTPSPIEMHAGTSIDYRLRVRGLPLKWRSEITAWEPPMRFVDEQRRGPYRKWIHEHRFDEIGDGTLCTDLVRYSVVGGALVNRFLVRRDIEKIFAFRTEQLRKLFGEAVVEPR
ncbi:MAG: SRPBCC family protein [Verrucomicrobiota bacterium]|nr:SRPBCC family protein [Verrucomicrobiota bacterium]